MPEISPSSFFGSRMDAITFHPFDPNSLAVARPQPDEAPVMKIALWSWLVMIDPSSSTHGFASSKYRSTWTTSSVTRVFFAKRTEGGFNDSTQNEDIGGWRR